MVEMKLTTMVWWIKVKLKGNLEGIKSFWKDIHITDMVDIIVNDEELVCKLIFTNTKKSQNTDACPNYKQPIQGNNWVRLLFYRAANENMVHKYM